MGAKVELRRWAVKHSYPGRLGVRERVCYFFEDSGGDFHLIIACW